MRCAVVSPDFPPPFVGGSLVYIHGLVEHCPERVDVLAGPLPRGVKEALDPRHAVTRSRLLVGSFAPTRARLALMYGFVAAWSLVTALRRRYDVAVLNLGLVGNSLLIPIFRVLQMPVVAVAYAEELTMALGGRSLKSRLKRRLLRASYPKADRFVAVSEFTRRTLVAAGVPAGRIQVIAPMIDWRKHVTTVDGLPGERYILAAGRLVARKGFDLLIDALASLRTRLPGVALYIVGSGPEGEQLARQIERAKLGDAVRLLGEVSDDELAALYRGADLFVLPNVALDNGDCEGCPIVLIEASAWGKPVIAGREGGTSTAVDDGVTGLLVDPRRPGELTAAIERVLTDTSFAARLGSAGQRKVRRDHDPVTNSRAFWDVLQEAGRRTRGSDSECSG